MSSMLSWNEFAFVASPSRCLELEGKLIVGTIRVEQHHIGQQAEGLFAEMVRSWAQPNAHRDGDYAIDFTVEVFDRKADGSERAAGRDFQVQVKGTKEIDGDTTHISYRLETSNLAHYLDNKRIPVFLVLVDVTSKQGYWLFLQQHAKEVLPPGWRSQSTITVKLPRSQICWPGEPFRDAVIAAGQWMMEQWPGSPQAALAAESARLEAIDPRMRYEVSATPGITKITVLPKQDIDIQFLVRGTDDSQRAFHDAIAFGIEVDPVAMGIDLKVEGLPIVQNQRLTRFRLGNEREVTVVLARERGGVFSTLEMRGTFSVGPRGSRGTVRVGKSLLELSLRLDFEKDAERPIGADWSFCSKEWHGRNALGVLNEYERLVRVFGDVQPSDQFAIELWWEGNRFIDAKMPADFGRRVLEGVGYVEVVRRIRHLFGPLQMPILVPSSMSDAEACTLDRIWACRNGQPVREKIDGAQFVIEAARERAIGLLQYHNLCGNLAIAQQHLPMELWGHKFDIGPVLVELEDAKLRIEGIFDITEQPKVSAVVVIQEPCTAVIRPLTALEEMERWFGAGRGSQLTRNGSTLGEGRPHCGD